MPRLPKLYRALPKWIKQLPRNQYMIFVSSLVGLVAGLAAVSLKAAVFYLHDLVERFLIENGHWWYVAMPLVGILLTVWMVSLILKGKKMDRGIASVLWAIAQKSGMIAKVNTYIHVLTSAVTVGFGGSAGLEAPIVMTGSAIGSNLGIMLRLNYQERMVILASGVAAGIAASFNAPIAGVMFAVEILLTEAIVSHFVPLLIAAAIGALCSKILLNEQILFNFVLQEPFQYINTPLYIVLGVVCGFVSLYYANMTRLVEHSFSKLGNRKWLKAFVGGIVLLVLTALFPPLFGEGYESIKHLASADPEMLLQHPFWESLNNSQEGLLVFVALIILVKVMATATTLSSGGNGGNFAPSLFTGAYLGFFFARFLNTVYAGKLSESNFAIVGMAGILSGVMYAPLTAIFLIAEITNGYGLLLPLMIVSATSFFITRHFQPFPMDTQKLAEEGEIFTADRDHNVLTRLRLTRLIEDDVLTIQGSTTLRELVEAIKHSKRNIFVVLGEEKVFQGIILLDDVKDVIFEPELYDTIFVESLMSDPPTVIQAEQNMDQVMEKFEQYNAWNLPVLDGKHYIGFVSKSRIFNEYRKIISAHKNVV